MNGTDPVAPPRSDAHGTSRASQDLTGDQETSGPTDRAGDLADQARQTARQVTNQVSTQAQQTAQTELAARKEQATSGLDNVASAIHQVGEQLRQNNQQQYGQYADLAAGQISRVAGYLRQRNINDLVEDVQNFARRQPELFLGGAFVLGLLGARFLKASSGQATSSSNNAPWQGSATRSPGYSGLGYGSRANDRFSDSATTNIPPMGHQRARYGAYDPGSAGQVVREVPQ
jgi:hypothetical protein